MVSVLPAGAVEIDNVEYAFPNSVAMVKGYVPAESIDAYSEHAEWGRFTTIRAIPTYAIGDVNHDGSIDGNDVSALLEMVLSGE